MKLGVYLRGAERSGFIDLCALDSSYEWNWAERSLMEIWLHVGLPDSEPGYHAWGLHHLGFATWASDEQSVLDRIPAKFDEYRDWLASHQLVARDADDQKIEVVERLTGHEVLFQHDHDSASVEEIDQAIEWLAASREDLLAMLEGIPEEVLNLNPPYVSFPHWADWRTTRATLAHLANSEIHYYLAMIGHQSVRSPSDASDPWREYLSATRAETVRFLQRLQRAPDRRRVRVIQRRGRRAPDGAIEEWSVRKVLRRLVRHELLHTKSIRRIRSASA